MKTTGTITRKKAIHGAPRLRYPTLVHQMNALARQADLRRASERGSLIRYERRRRLISQERVNRIQVQMMEDDLDYVMCAL